MKMNKRVVWMPGALVAESFGHFDAADYERQLAGAPPAAAPE